MSENLIPKFATVKNFAIATLCLSLAIVVAGVLTPIFNRGINSVMGPKAPATPAPAATANA